MNCPSGAPPHCVGQDVTRPDGPQVSAQGNSTLFMLDRNIVRHGPFSGVFWQVGATGTLDNSFVCGMQFSGVLSDRKAGKTAGASLRGSASVLNGRIGVEVRNNVGLDLGTAADPGHNAFAGNPAARRSSTASRATTSCPHTAISGRAAIRRATHPPTRAISTRSPMTSPTTAPPLQPPWTPPIRSRTNRAPRSRCARRGRRS